MVFEVKLSLCLVKEHCHTLFLSVVIDHHRQHVQIAFAVRVCVPRTGGITKNNEIQSVCRKVGAEGPSFSIASRSRPDVAAEEASTAANPGPGQYDSQCDAGKGPAYSFVKVRPALTCKASALSAGPSLSCLMVPQYALTRSWPSCTRSICVMLQHLTMHRGGAENASSRLVSTNAQAQRQTVGRQKPGPAPTDYNVTAPSQHGPAWTFPTTARDLSGSEVDAPAPGDYSVPVCSHSC